MKHARGGGQLIIRDKVFSARCWNDQKRWKKGRKDHEKKSKNMATNATLCNCENCEMTVFYLGLV